LTQKKAQKPDVTFDCFPWPSGANADAESAVSTFTRAGSYALALTTIHAHAADQIYIVGNSSGCAIANVLDRGLRDTSKITLVALDGFAPNREQRARPSTRQFGNHLQDRAPATLGELLRCATRLAAREV
jgi:hypothetical protein